MKHLLVAALFSQILAQPLAQTTVSSPMASDDSWRPWFDRARKYAEDVDQESDKARVRTALIRLRLRTDSITFEEAKAHLSTIPTDERKKDFLVTIAQKQAESGEIEGARQTAKSISDRHNRSLAFWRIAGAQIRNDDLAAARTTADSVAVSIHREQLLSQIVDAQLDAGDFDGARATARSFHDPDRRSRAVKEVKSMTIGLSTDDPKPALKEAGFTTRTIQDVLRRLTEKRAREGDLETAVTLAHQITTPWARAYAFCIIARAAAGNGNAKIARESIQSAKAAAEKEQDRLLKAICHHKIAFAHVALCDVEAARAAVARALAVGGRIYKRNFSSNRAFLEDASVSALANAGRLDEAKAVARDQKGGIFMNRSIAAGYVRSGRIEEVTEWIETLEQPIQRVNACLNVAHALVDQQVSDAKK